MPDGRNHAGEGGDESDYDIGQFAIDHGLSLAEVRQLIERHGTSRAALEAAIARTEARRARREKAKGKREG